MQLSWHQDLSGNSITAGMHKVPTCFTTASWSTKMMHKIPLTCCWLQLYDLRLHGASWGLPDPLGPLSQLSNLQCLHIYSHQRAEVSLKAIANLSQLQLLSLGGLSISFSGGLKRLPKGITHLQLSDSHWVPPVSDSFCLQDLSHFSKISCLDVSCCRISFEEEGEVVDLQHIKKLILEVAVAEGSPDSVIASLNTTKQLQDLNLRAFRLSSIGGYMPDLQLGRLLSSLHSLQKLDVTFCSHVHLGPSEYTPLRLHSFACQYSQLSIVEDVPFSPIYLHLIPAKAKPPSPACRSKVH